MPVMTCGGCGSAGNLVEEEGVGLVCEKCGAIARESDLRNEVELEAQSGINYTIGVHVPTLGRHYNTKSQPMPPRLRVTYSETAQNKVFGMCNRIASLLHLPRVCEDQVKRLVMQLMDNRWKTGRKGELMVAACCYIVCRTNSKPLTLLDVSDVVQCNVFELGKVYNKVVEKLGIKLTEVDPALYLERASSQLEITEQQQVQVNALAIRFLNVAKEDWLVTGRKPAAITAGALMLAMEQLGLRPMPNKIATALNTSTQTAKQRYRELKENITQLGKKLLPWGNDITTRNVKKYIPAILKQLEFMNECKKQQQATELQEDQHEKEDKKLFSLKLPPSFSKNVVKRRTRDIKIRRAKLRIQKLINSNPSLVATLGHLVSIKIEDEEETLPQTDDQLDEEDLLIEKLLLDGVEESAILEGYYDSLLQRARSTTQEEPELGEHDIPDAALGQYLRSQAEVEMLRNLESTEPPSKRQRLEAK